MNRRSENETSYDLGSESGSYASSSASESGGGICRNLCCFLLIMLLLGGTAALIYKVAEGENESSDSGERNNLSGGKEGSVKSYNSCGKHKKSAMISFDDGPNEIATPNVLKDLKSAGMRATFFLSPAVGGEPTTGQCSLVEKILEDGHSVQSHSWDHVNFLNLTDIEVKENLEKNKEWIEKCAGSQRSKLSLTQFRPPYGNLDYVRAQYISNELGYTVATWNIETQDHLGGNKDDIIARIDDKYNELIPDGDESVVILMHDKKYVDDGTIGSIPMIKTYFDNLGYTFVSGEECYDKCDDYVSFCRMNNVWPGTFESPQKAVVN